MTYKNHALVFSNMERICVFIALAMNTQGKLLTSDLGLRIAVVIQILTSLSAIPDNKILRQHSP